MKKIREIIEEISMVYVPIILLWFIVILFIFTCLGLAVLLLKFLLGI